MVVWKLRGCPWTRCWRPLHTTLSPGWPSSAAAVRQHVAHGLAVNVVLVLHDSKLSTHESNAVGSGSREGVHTKFDRGAFNQRQSRRQGAHRARRAVSGRSSPSRQQQAVPVAALVVAVQYADHTYCSRGFDVVGHSATGRCCTAQGSRNC